jgi:hypothetical protein
MTATLKEQRHITLLPDAEETSSLPQDQDYNVQISPNGVIMMRPKKQPQRTLLEHLDALRGLEIEHRRDPIPDRVSL